MGLTLILTRHAESVWHEENRYAGRSDIELTDHGRAQAARLAAWAAAAGLDAVACSPLRRSRDTAAPAAEAASLPLAVDPRLVELDFGVAEGLTRAELEQRVPADVRAFSADPVGAHFPSGEHPGEAVGRYLEAIEELRRRHPDGAVLVVGHNTMIRLVLCRLLGIGVHRYRAVFPELANCSLTELRLDDDAASLLRFNCRLKGLR